MSRARNELSRRNQYYISKHRYLELKHFCLQYPEWQREYNQISMYPPSDGFAKISANHSDGSFIEKIALLRNELMFKMELVKSNAMIVDDYLGPFIFRAVTEDLSYNYLYTKTGMACSMEMYYDRYHKFFWLLDRARE